MLSCTVHRFFATALLVTSLAFTAGAESASVPEAWDGLVQVKSKRLEAGTFELPAIDKVDGDEPPKVVIDSATLASLLEGIDLRARRRRWYRRPT